MNHPGCGRWPYPGYETANPSPGLRPPHTGLPACMPAGVRRLATALLESPAHPSRGEGKIKNSKLSLLPHQPARLDAVRGAGFADGFGQVIPHRVSGQVQQRRDVARGQSGAGETQRMTLAVVERIGFGPRIDRELRIDRAAS